MKKILIGLALITLVGCKTTEVEEKVRRLESQIEDLEWTHKHMHYCEATNNIATLLRERNK